MMKKQSRNNSGALYFFLLILYEMKSFFFSISPVITLGLTYIVVSVNIYYVILVNIRNNRPPFFKGLNIFFLLLVIYGLLLIFSGKTLIIQEAGIPVNTTAFFIKSITSFGPIYAFYDIGMKQGLSYARMVRWFYILIFVSIALFAQNRAELIAGGKNVAELTNNVGYKFVALIPFLFLLHNKRILQYCLLAFFLGMTLVSAKRGAIVVAAIAVLFFFVLSLKETNKESKKESKLWLYVLTILFITIGAYLTIRFLNTNDYLQYRYQKTIEGDSSFRDVIYAELWMHFINSTDVIRQILGYGAWATLDITINYAHQDWLEILTDMGLLGVMAYLYFWICFGKTIRRCKKSDLTISFSMLMVVFVIYFAKSMFSMAFDSLGLLPGLCIGYSLSYDSRLSLFNIKS